MATRNLSASLKALIKYLGVITEKSQQDFGTNGTCSLTTLIVLPEENSLRIVGWKNITVTTDLQCGDWHSAMEWPYKIYKTCVGDFGVTCTGVRAASLWAFRPSGSEKTGAQQLGTKAPLSPNLRPRSFPKGLAYKAFLWTETEKQYREYLSYKRVVFFKKYSLQYIDNWQNKKRFT